jgi:heme/copper-type cytochrome/quinol oxidase subunit 1
MLILCMAVVSQLTSTFAGKPMFGYLGQICALVTVVVLTPFLIAKHSWLPFASMEAAHFLILSAAVAFVPINVLLGSWLLTLFQGSIRLASPMQWTLAAMLALLFSLGGGLASLEPVLLTTSPQSFLEGAFSTGGTLAFIYFSTMAASMHWLELMHDYQRTTSAKVQFAAAVTGVALSTLATLGQGATLADVGGLGGADMWSHLRFFRLLSWVGGALVYFSVFVLSLWLVVRGIAGLFGVDLDGTTQSANASRTAHLRGGTPQHA